MSGTLTPEMELLIGPPNQSRLTHFLCMGRVPIICQTRSYLTSPSRAAHPSILSFRASSTHPVSLPFLLSYPRPANYFTELTSSPKRLLASHHPPHPNSSSLKAEVQPKTISFFFFFFLKTTPPPASIPQQRQQQLTVAALTTLKELLWGELLADFPRPNLPLLRLTG